MKERNEREKVERKNIDSKELKGSKRKQMKVGDFAVLRRVRPRFEGI